MDRRSFIFDAAAGVLFMACPQLFTACRPGQSLRFGIVTDVHYAQKPSDPRCCESVDKLKAAIEYFNSCKLDFVIELGDFKDCSDHSKETTLAYLKAVEDILSTSKAPVYHCLGNHDMDRISKDEFLSHVSNPDKADGKANYSFVIKGIRFIVMDAEFRPDGVPYDCGNYNWKESFIPQEEIDWLSAELRASREPVVVFVHQMLDSYDTSIPEESFVTNAEAVREVLSGSGKVMACFQGHWHDGSYSNSDGIHYYTQRAMIVGHLPDNNSYSIVEIDRDRNFKVSGLADCQSIEWKTTHK